MPILVPTSQKTCFSLGNLLSMTEASKEGHVSLEWVLCIYYPFYFRKNTIGVRALIDSGSEVNAIIPAYTSKLGLKVYSIDVGAQKIDVSTLEIFRIVLASFQVEDKFRRARFFQETFLVANISAEVVLDMPFLIFNNTDVQFVEKKFT